MNIDSIEFLNKFNNNIFKNFFQYDDEEKNKFINFLKEYNVYIGGEYLTCLLFDIDYIIRPCLYISNKNIENFILNLFEGFIITGQSLFNNNYILNNDNYFNFITIEFLNKNEEINEIICVVYKEKDGSIDKFLNKSIAMDLFEIWWDPKINKIKVNNIEIFKNDSKKIIGNVKDEFYNWYNDKNSYLKTLCNLLRKKKVIINIPKKREIEILNSYKEIEKRIILKILDEFSNNPHPEIRYNILSKEHYDIKKSDHINNDIYKKIHKYLNIEENIKILINNGYDINIAYFNILMCVLVNKFEKYTYKEFIKVINEIYIPNVTKEKINSLIDIIIKKYFLNEYQIEIINKKGKIKFVIENAIEKSKITGDIKEYVKQILLFYYKNKIYKNYNIYKFIDIVLNKFKLINIHYNIHIETDSDLYTRILTINEDRHYYDIIYGYEIEDIKEYINEDDDNILLVTPGRNDIICISRTNLDKLISNYKDIWYYDCSKKRNNEYIKNPYIKLDLNIAYYIPYKYIFALFNSPNKVFYIISTDEEIKETMSYKITEEGQEESPLRSVLGTWHCQSGTNIKISIISTLEIKRTDYSEKKEKSEIELDKSYSRS